TSINNRPGRFDVMIEVTNPDRALRMEFLRGKLPEISAAALEQATDQTEGLSFAHLQELLRLSGLYVIEANRTARSDGDVLRAVKVLRDAHEDAIRGFEKKPQEPFGLARRPRRRA